MNRLDDYFDLWGDATPDEIDEIQKRQRKLAAARQRRLAEGKNEADK